MRSEILLIVATILSQHADPASSPHLAAPPPPSSITFAAPPAVQAPTPTPPAAPTPPPEHVTPFDADQAGLDWSAGEWRVTAGATTLKDFGRREAEARQALRLIRELRLNQRGTIGGPTPALEYWLSDGQAPSRPTTGLRVLPIDAATLRVEHAQDQWVLRDDRRVLFGFGGEESDARQALAVVHKYGFAQVGTLGPASPSMIVFFGGPETAAPAGPAVPASPRPTAPPADLANALLTPAVPALREGSLSGKNMSVLSQNADRTPFDWRQVQIREENGAWKLAAGSSVLADFGTDEHAARLGLSAVQYYRFNEECRLGGPAGRFTYFLASGQPGHGAMFGVEAHTFQPDRLVVRQVDSRWAVCAGDTPLVEMGDAREGADQVLELIRRQQCDRMCRVGTADGKGMTFLVRSR